MQPYCIGGLKRATFSSTLIRMRFVLVATVVVAFSFAQVQGWIQTGGYVVLFGLLFACGLGLPLPEDVPLIVAGALIAKGQMNWVVAAICAWCGIIGGDCVLYYMGRRFGLEITRVPFIGKHVTKERIQRVEKLFHRHGVGVVAVGRLVAGIRGAMVVAAGAIRYNFVTFIIADGLAALYFEEAVLLPPNEPAVVGRAEIRKWYQKLFSTGVSHFKMESRTVLYEGPVGYERGAYSVRVPGSGRNGEAARPPNGTKGESARAGGTCQIHRGS